MDRPIRGLALFRAIVGVLAAAAKLRARFVAQYASAVGFGDVDSSYGASKLVRWDER